MGYGVSPIRVAGFAALVAAAIPNGPAAADDKARLSGLSDAHFGLVAGAGDKSISQNVCAFTSSRTERYAITATGDGAGGAFALSSGTSELPYDVLWADAPNLQSGTALAPSVPASGFSASVKQHSCNSGPPATASLTIVLRDSALRSARAGTYSGSVQITIFPE